MKLLDTLNVKAGDSSLAKTESRTLVSREPLITATEYYMVFNTAIRDYSHKSYLRVLVKKSKILVSTIFGTQCESYSNTTYKCFDNLPEPVREKVSVLSMLDHQSQEGRELDGVGIRISENIFWVER